MTGEKNRFATTEKLWNLDDKQLSSPEHDIMVLQLLNKNYIREKLALCGDDDRIEITSEYPLVARNGFINGFVDIVVIEYSDYNRRCFIIECKPKITSFGETLRQIRAYQEFIKSNPMRGAMKYLFYLYTSDTIYKAAFESQGIAVITPTVM